MKYRLSESEIEEVKKHGLSEKDILRQIDFILSGTEKPRLLRPATVADGIHSFSESEINELVEIFHAKKNSFTFTKFVPASGAATRMFKALSNVYFHYDSITLSEIKDSAGKNPDFEKTLFFFNHLKDFAFTRLLENEFLADETTNLIPILKIILTEEGLNLLDSPKALIPFHSAGINIYSPAEEHLTEAEKLFGTSVKVHFTISEKHRVKFEKIFHEFSKTNNNGKEKSFISYSYQLGKTDTIALDENGNLVKDNDGNILFRPAGHGALIENLNQIDSDFIYINNIDNIAHLHHQDSIITFKQTLTGLAIKLREIIHSYLSLLEKRDVSINKISEIKNFISKFMFISIPHNSLDEKNILFNLLNRPFRIAAMVKNEGEPGGGPFWVEGNGEDSLQIIEKAQVDFTDSSQVEILNASTHFNPVDLVCSVKNHHGEKFDLMKFINPDLGIVTKKSFNGKEIKVLEQPGLWNGAMHNWITFFVEVPLFTFNPVKEVNDLLKKYHQPIKV